MEGVATGAIGSHGRFRGRSTSSLSLASVEDAFATVRLSLQRLDRVSYVSNGTSVWEIIAAVATAFAAGFTAWLAWSTRQLASQTRDVLSAEWMPLLTLAQHPSDGRTGALVTIEQDKIVENLVLFRLEFEVTNVGSGPALNASIHVTVSTDPKTPAVSGARISLGLVAKDQLVPRVVTIPESSRPYLGDATHYLVTLTYEGIDARQYETSQRLYAQGGIFRPPSNQLVVTANAKKTLFRPVSS